MALTPDCRNLPYKPRSGRIFTALLAGWLTTGVALGQQPPPTQQARDEAIALAVGGQRLSGQLLAGDSPRFGPRDAAAPMELDTLAEIRFPLAQTPPRVADLWHVYLYGRQRCDARVLAVSEDSVELQLAADGRKRLARAAVVGFTRGAQPALFPRQQMARDVLLLTTGDEIFGKLSFQQARGARLSGSFGELELPVERLGGARLRAADSQPTTVTGQTIRVWYHSQVATGELDSSQNCLIGRLARVTDTDLVLDHAQLGRLEIARPWITSIAPIHNGTRTTLDPRYHHLGNEVRSTFDVTWPEATELTATWQIESVPAGTIWLTANVIELEHMGPGAKYAQELAAGHLRSNVVLNGETVDHVNRHVTATTSQPQRVRVRLPREKLRVGKNAIAIRQVSQAGEPEEFDDFGLFDLAVEIDPAP